MAAAIGAAAYGSTLLLSATWTLPAACLPAAIVGALASLPIYARMPRRGYSHETKASNMKSILLAFEIWSAAYAAGLAIGIVARG